MGDVLDFCGARRRRGLPELVGPGRLAPWTARALRRWRTRVARLTQLEVANLAGTTVGRYAAAERGACIDPADLACVLSAWQGFEPANTIDKSVH